MNTLHIRSRVNGDLPGCVAALTEVHAADGYPSRWPAETAGWLTPADMLHAWTAHLDDTVVGHVVMRSVADDAMASLLAASGGVPPGRLASLSRLFVVPRARRRGVASVQAAWTMPDGTHPMVAHYLSPER